MNEGEDLMKTVQLLYNNHTNNLLYSRIKQTNTLKHLQYTNIFTIDYIALTKIYEIR